MPVTIKEISAHAKTSEATVSMVLNGRYHSRVSEATRLRVETIAKDLGYVPRRAARALATGKTYNIGVVLNDLSNPFFGIYASLIQQRLWPHGYAALPLETGASRIREKQVLDWLPQRSVDGVIVLEGLWGAEEEYVAAYRNEPFVLRHQDDGNEHSSFSHVNISYGSGVAALAKLFQANGWDRVGLLIQSEQLVPQDKSYHPRPRMIRDAMRAQGLQCPRKWWCGAGESKNLTLWYEQARAMLSQYPEINALVIHNSMVAPAVYAAAESVGKVIGVDLAIAAYDDSIATPWLRPGLTVIHEPIEEVANHLIEMLFEQLNGTAESVANRTIQTNIIARASTGALPSSGPALISEQ